jgi:hypothetical protein
MTDDLTIERNLAGFKYRTKLISQIDQSNRSVKTISTMDQSIDQSKLISQIEQSNRSTKLISPIDQSDAGDEIFRYPLGHD